MILGGGAQRNNFDLDATKMDDRTFLLRGSGCCRGSSVLKRFAIAEAGYGLQGRNFPQWGRTKEKLRYLRIQFTKNKKGV